MAKQRSLVSFFKKKALGKAEADSGDTYDLTARNPLFSNPQKSTGFWELHFLVRHHHPSVSLFAETLVNGKFVEYDGDVLNDFSTKNFLDRFVSRNPKKVALSNSQTNVKTSDDGDNDDIEIDSDNEDESVASEELEQLLFEEEKDEDDPGDSSDGDSLSLNEEDFAEELKELDFPVKKRKIS